MIFVCLGGVVAAWLTTAVGNTTSVLALRGPVDRGAVVEADDLMTVRVNVDPAVRTVPAEQLEQVVGQRTTVDLAGGALLPADVLTTSAVPGEGQSVVGVTLTTAQLPAQGLRAGDNVRIVATPRAQDDPPISEPDAIDAVVVGTNPLLETGQVVVDVLVPAGDAAGLAAQVATGRIVLVLDAAEGR